MRVFSPDGSGEANIRLTLQNVVEDGESSTGSATIWTGAKTVFTKASSANPNNIANQDRLTDNVWITRGNEGGQIYNIRTETSASSSVSPVGTAWAQGKIEDIDNLTFQPFRPAVGQPRNVVGKDLVMHLIQDNIYLEVKFLSWADDQGGGFSYERATP